MYMWRNFDVGAIRDEMAQIADIGFDVVRVFALTCDFLPRPLTVSAEMVARLVQVAQAAKDNGLRIVPTLIALNMSGRLWWPDWMRADAGEPVDIFSDPTALRSQALLAETCAQALRGDDAIRAFDLANEIDGAQRPQSRDAARAWATVLAGAVRRSTPGVPIRIGAHLPSLTTANNMRIDDLAAIMDEDVMHAYPLYSDAARSFLDPELVPFACALCGELAGKDRRPLMQEFGLCTAAPDAAPRTITDDFLGQPRTQYLASEDQAATYYAAVLDRLARSDAAGAYAWCYGDYDARLFDLPPFNSAVRERSFGLVRADGSEKPAAKVFRATRAQRDAGSLATARAAPVLDVSADEYYGDPAVHFERLYYRWLSQAAA